MNNTLALNSAQSFVKEFLYDTGIPDEHLASLVVGLAWTRQHPEVLQPGRTIIHPSYATTGEIVEISNELVGVIFEGDRKDFPLDQVASTFATQLASQKLMVFNGSQELALGRVEAETDVLVKR